MVNAKKIHPRGLLAFPEVVKEARPKTTETASCDTAQWKESED
jgi:hypothetical protein